MRVALTACACVRTAVLVDPGSAARLLLSESDLADGFYFEVLLFVDGTTETCVLHPKLNKLVLTGALRRGSHAAIGSWETRQDETVEDPVMFSVITELRAAHDMGLCTVVAATLKARPVSSPRRYYLDVFCDDLSDVRHWLRGDEELFVGAGSLEEADFKQSHTTLSKLRSAGTRGTFEDSIVCGFVVARSRLVHFGTPKSNGSAAFLLNLTISDEAGVVMPVVLWNSQAALYYKTLPGSVIAIRGFRVQRSYVRALRCAAPFASHAVASRGAQRYDQGLGAERQRRKPAERRAHPGAAAAGLAERANCVNAHVHAATRSVQRHPGWRGRPRARQSRWRRRSRVRSAQGARAGASAPVRVCATRVCVCARACVRCTAVPANGVRARLSCTACTSTAMCLWWSRARGASSACS